MLRVNHGSPERSTSFPKTHPHLLVVDSLLATGASFFRKTASLSLRPEKTGATDISPAESCLFPNPLNFGFRRFLESLFLNRKDASESRIWTHVSRNHNNRLR
ncbi:hypothetical protein CEXT_166621 [Caerostris extrusa]|uniref:Uncharacterized protein n=1 Tax=Caerostris extrusa TaxID=172846 RepID=A0AAV4SX83_CAEEX|nr:hypothetical protein CEXT_166621 [Caerostris extrusa]